MTISKGRNSAGFEPSQDDVFSRIAGRYDVLCDLFSLGIHRTWKWQMARQIAQMRWSQMIDVAAGTGDISLRVARLVQLSDERRCLVTDICPEMLGVARSRAEGSGLSFLVSDAHDLSAIPSESMDVYASSLGMKICNRKSAMEQALRVLKPGGSFICLEASRLQSKFLQRLYLFYMSVCMPTLGWLATGGDASAYAYLLRGIRNFPDAATFAEELRELGFEDVSYQLLTFGIVAIHTAKKPERVSS